MAEKDDDDGYIYVKFITTRAGRRIAAAYGLKAFRIKVRRK